MLFPFVNEQQLSCFTREDMASGPCVALQAPRRVLSKKQEARDEEI